MRNATIEGGGAFRATLRSKMSTDVGIMVLSQGGALLTSFALTPYQLHAMGTERYGILAITAALLGYLSFFDIGVGWALTHFVSYLRATGEEDDARRMIFAGIVVSVTMGLLGCLLLAMLASPVSTRVLNISRASVGPAMFSIRTAALGLPIILLTGVFSGVGRGLGMFKHVGVIRFFAFATLNVGWAIFSKSPHSIQLVSLTQLLISVVVLVIWVQLVKSRFAGPLFIRTLEGALYARLLSYGIFSSLSSFGYLLLTAADKVILAAIFPVSEIVYYTIPFTLASQIPVVSITVAMVLFPRFSAAAAPRNEQTERKSAASLAKVSRRLNALFNAVVILGFVLIGPAALRLWLGTRFARHAGFVLQVLAVGYGALAVGSIDQVYLQAHGRVRTSATIFLASGLGGVMLLVVLSRTHGLGGAATGSALALAAVGIGNIVAASRIRDDGVVVDPATSAGTEQTVGGP